jgi:ribonucleoside-diphosphate reductase alpha chain
MDHDKLIEIHPIFRKFAEEHGFFDQELINEITARSGSIGGITEIPEKIRSLFVTAYDITPEWHIRLQAAFQKYTDNAVSKTINFPNNAEIAEVDNAYRLAYELGCKGITVYRDGSRTNQVLSIGGDGIVVTPPRIGGAGAGKLNQKKKGNDALTMGGRSLNNDVKSNNDQDGNNTAQKSATDNQEEPENEKMNYNKITPRPRPTTTSGVTEKIRTGCGNLYVTINRDEHGLCEVFTRMGKSGGCANAQSEAVARLVSLALRSGIAPAAIVKHLRSIRCPAQVMTKGGMMFSCPDAIAQAMERHMDEKVEKNNILNDSGKSPTCPDCGGMVEYMEGCLVCRACGYTECE